MGTGQGHGACVSLPSPQEPTPAVLGRVAFLCLSVFPPCLLCWDLARETFLHLSSLSLLHCAV